jgi:hypothetical protein
VALAPTLRSKKCSIALVVARFVRKERLVEILVSHGIINVINRRGVLVMGSRNLDAPCRIFDLFHSEILSQIKMDDVNGERERERAENIPYCETALVKAHEQYKL